MNKYADVGFTLGQIADHIRTHGGSAIERDYHAVFRRMIGILEEHAKTHEEILQELAIAYNRIADLEIKVQAIQLQLTRLR